MDNLENEMSSAEITLREVYNRHEHRMSDFPYSHTKEMVLAAMEEYKSLHLSAAQKEIEELKEQVAWLRKFVWKDTINISHSLENFTPPFRVGRKQKRAILDSLGHEVGVFVTGQEAMAKTFCEFLNQQSAGSAALPTDGEIEKEAPKDKGAVAHYWFIKAAKWMRSKLSQGDRASERETGWVSVKDRLPEQEENVLICEHKFGVRYPGIYIGYIDHLNKWMFFGEDGEKAYWIHNPDYYTITHWMPLPSPPSHDNTPPINK